MSTKRPDPLFILGDARSGTTYLTHLLIQHREIGIAPESLFVVRLLRAYGSQTLSTPTALGNAFDLIADEAKFRDWLIRMEDILPLLENRLPINVADLIRTILMVYCEREFPGCIVWGIKKGYIPFLSELFEHFPKARFIHIVRDGRAVFSSKKKAIYTRTGKPFEENPLRAAGRWIRLIQTFRNFSQQHPANCLEVSYERLLTELPTVLSSIFDFLEVADVKTDFQEQGPSWIPEWYRYLHPNVGKPPQVARIDAWKEELAMGEIQRFEAVAGCELENHGYTLHCEERRYNLPVLIYRLTGLVFVFRMAFKQFVKSIRRPRSLSS